MTLGKKGCFLFAAILAALILTGCAASFNSRGLNLAAEANYTQIIREFEPQQGKYSDLPFQDLIYLCSAYGELKNYRKIFPCLEAAQAKVNAGDFTADAWNHSATPSRLKAIALIELGQYEEAVRAAEISNKIVVDKQLTQFEVVKVLEVLGISYALAGKTDKANAQPNSSRDYIWVIPTYWSRMTAILVWPEFISSSENIPTPSTPFPISLRTPTPSSKPSAGGTYSSTINYPLSS